MSESIENICGFCGLSVPRKAQGLPIKYFSRLGIICICGFQAQVEYWNKLSLMRQERDNAKALVLRLILAARREGWEEGESEEEVQSAARDALAKWGLDPFNDKEAVRKIIEEVMK